jgi:uncharacterized protein YicC (UPF0701 family)
MKEKEGESLKNDILSRLCTIENYVSVVEEESPKTLQAYKDRLYAKKYKLQQSFYGYL